MMSARSVGGVDDDSPSPARRPSRYESQKRRDWQTFTRYLGAHRPPLQLRRCSGAHVLEFLRYLDRFGKTRVHAPPCPAYGGGGGAREAQAQAASSAPACQCQCPLRQAWGSLDALVGRLRAAFDERHGARGGRVTAAAATAAQHQPESGAATATANPFAARAVRLYLRDVRDAQARARGISYSRKKKRRTSKQQQQASGRATAGAAASEQQGRDADAAAVGCARPHGNVVGTTFMSAAAEPAAPAPQPFLAGVDVCCEYYASVIGGPTTANNGVAGFYLPLLFNSFG